MVTYQVIRISDKTEVHSFNQKEKEILYLDNSPNLRIGDWIYPKDNKWLHVDEEPRYYLEKLIKSISHDENEIPRTSFTRTELDELAEYRSKLLDYLENPILFDEEEDKKFLETREFVHNLFLNKIKDDEEESE